MKKLTIAFGQEMNPERMIIYAEALQDLSIDALETAFRQCLQTCKFFPTVADIRGQIAKQLESSDHFNAERAWTMFIEIFNHFYHPDIGVYENAPQLDEAGKYALRTIGGIQRFKNTMIVEQNFVKKDFITAYLRYRETGGYLAPTRDQAAVLLDNLRKVSKEELPKLLFKPDLP